MNKMQIYIAIQIITNTNQLIQQLLKNIENVIFIATFYGIINILHTYLKL